MTFVAKETKLLTIPLLKLAVGKPAYVKLTAAIAAAPVSTSRRATASATPRKPGLQVNAINLEDSAVCQVQCPEAVKTALDAAFPDAGYVGKCFSFTKLDRATTEGKQYKGFKVVEIQDPATPDAAAAPAAAAAATGRSK